jgi:single-strand DNA-binding protein
MFNKVILVGNLTRDVEVKYLQNSSAVANLGLAVNRRYKDASGEQRDETCFIDVTLFGRTAEVANQYLKRGSKVLIEGRLKFDQWTDQNGQKRSKHTVVAESMQMLDSRGGGSDNQGQDSGYSSQGNQSGYDNYKQDNYSKAPTNNNKDDYKIKEIDVNEDDIPF